MLYFLEIVYTSLVHSVYFTCKKVKYIQAKLFIFPLEWLNSKEDCSFHSWKWLVKITTNSPFYGCVLSALAFE